PSISLSHTHLSFYYFFLFVCFFLSFFSLCLPLPHSIALYLCLSSYPFPHSHALSFSSLLLSPSQVLGHREDLDACHRNVDPELLKMAVTPYPKLKSALFSPLSVHSVPPPDISLYHLLQALSPFHPTRFFTWQTANTFTAGGECPWVLHCEVEWVVR
ncbi:hypothetical protein FKM82_028406, partial [Ascaphus truei]